MFKPIQKNSTIGVISPAWIPIEKRMSKGFSYLENRGFKLKKGKNLGKVYKYFAGTDEERLADIHDMYADPEVDLILCARGGWGGLRIVDRIDYELIKRNPKPLIGYSDITTLQLAIWAKTVLSSYSGPMLGVEMGKGILPFTETHFWGQIQNERSEYIFSFAETETSVLCGGQAQGIILGGCLSLVSHLLGTEFSPDYEGVILFLEDVGEKPYKIDRYLAHLKQAGVFEKINGLILGDFVDCVPEEGESSFTVNELIESYFLDSDYPVLIKFPYGHDDYKFSMPVGVQTSMDTEIAELHFSNPFYSK